MARRAGSEAGLASLVFVGEVIWAFTQVVAFLNGLSERVRREAGQKAAATELYSRPVGNKAVQEIAAARTHEQAHYGRLPRPPWYVKL